MLLRLVVAGAAALLTAGAVVRDLQSRSWCRSPPVVAYFFCWVRNDRRKFVLLKR
jgi:hypothetical protein